VFLNENCGASFGNSTSPAFKCACRSMLQCLVMCSSVLQHGAVCCNLSSVLQCVVMCSSVLQHLAVAENQLEKEEMCAVVCCNVLQRVVVSLQWVAAVVGNQLEGEEQLVVQKNLYASFGQSTHSVNLSDCVLSLCLFFGKHTHGRGEHL